MGGVCGHVVVHRHQQLCGVEAEIDADDLTRSVFESVRQSLSENLADQRAGRELIAVFAITN